MSILMNRGAVMYGLRFREAIMRLNDDFLAFYQDEYFIQIVESGLYPELWSALLCSSQKIIEAKFTRSLDTKIEFGEILKGEESFYASITDGVVCSILGRDPHCIDFSDISNDENKATFSLRPYLDKIHEEDSCTVSVLHIHPDNHAHSDDDFLALMINDPLMNLLAIGKDGRVYIAIKMSSHSDSSPPELGKMRDMHKKLFHAQLEKWRDERYRRIIGVRTKTDLQAERAFAGYAVFHNTFIDFCEAYGLIYFPKGYVNYERV
jgi:hypothetical protein